ncbi:hypothetical protein BJX62DRAFT_219848 [Aspergillus germanicus]
MPPPARFPPQCFVHMRGISSSNLLIVCFWVDVEILLVIIGEIFPTVEELKYPSDVVWWCWTLK